MPMLLSEKKMPWFCMILLTTVLLRCIHFNYNYLLLLAEMSLKHQISLNWALFSSPNILYTVAGVICSNISSNNFLTIWSWCKFQVLQMVFELLKFVDSLRSSSTMLSTNLSNSCFNLLLMAIGTTRYT